MSSACMPRSRPTQPISEIQPSQIQLPPNCGLEHRFPHGHSMRTRLAHDSRTSFSDFSALNSMSVENLVIYIDLFTQRDLMRLDLKKDPAVKAMSGQTRKIPGRPSGRCMCLWPQNNWAHWQQPDDSNETTRISGCPTRTPGAGAAAAAAAAASGLPPSEPGQPGPESLAVTG